MAMQPPSHGGPHSHAFISEAKEAIGTGNLVAMQRYATEGSKEDLVTFWTRCTANNDSATATAIVKLLSAMLVKCDGETGWSALGATCIRRVLAEQTKSILRNVSSGKAIYINPTLRMLITMVHYDVGSLANEVYAAVNISTFKGWPKLLNRAGPPRKEQKVSLGKRKREENTSSKEAVRGLFAEFYFALLHNLQPTLKAELLSHRQFTTELFKHIGHDDAFTLNKALKEMTHVVETHDVPRTAKVKFFNEWTLERLVSLYARDFTADEEEDADQLQTQLQQTLQTFFLRATTISNEGISFASYGLHPPASFPKVKLFNPILGAFCLTLKPLADDLQLELLLKMLASTAELIAHYLNNANLDLDPQLEVSWIGAMRLLDSILALPLPEDYDTGIIDLQPVPTRIKADNLLPSNLAKVLVKGLQHESDLVKLMTAKTFWSALKKLMSSRTAGIVDESVLELVQSRCPELQVILKLATQPTSAETSEEVVLLREVCILLLNGYVTLFEDLPSFDFATLFSLILSPADGTFITDKERDTVVGMVSSIRGLPWLQRKKDTESVFATLLQNVLRLNTTDDATRRATSSHVLDALIQEESFMFSETSVSKSESLIRSLQAVEPSEQQLLVRFAEECFIRFQATPYRYYDQLVAWATKNEVGSTDLTATMSCVLLTLKEQLQYQVSPCASQWLISFCGFLANTGDDWAFCEHVAGQQIESSHNCNEQLSLWNAQWLIVYLGDAEREYLPATIDKWTLLQQMVDQLEEADLQVLKAWLLERWLRALSEQPEENVLLMQFVVSLFNQADVAKMPDLAHLLTKQLVSGSSLVDCSSLVPADLALSWLGESLDCGAPAFQLLPCLDQAHPITGQQLGILLDKASTDESALQNVAELLRNGAVVKSHLTLPETSVTNTAYPKAMAKVLAELVKDFPSTVSQALQFAKIHGPQTIASLLVALLSLDEANASVLTILHGHEDYYCKTDLSKEGDATCLLALLHESKRLRQHLSKQLSASSSLLGLRVFVELQSYKDSADDAQAVAYMQQIFDGLTRSFAEDRVEEDKVLSESTLVYVDALATSITKLGADCFVHWATVTKLAPLVEAALANQIQHLAVIHLLAALATASFEAFPYAKSAQTILAHKDALLREETRLPLAELLERMLHVTPTCASVAWLDEILRLYSGSLDPFDQVLFKLLQALEGTLRVSVGSRIKHWRLEESRASDSHSADDPVRTKAVEVVLNKNLALSTLTRFDVCLGLARDPQQVYNLRFILPVIAGFLYADESMEQLRLLLDHHALGLVFLGLAHPEHEVRCTASSTLALFDRLIRASKLREKMQLETLLSALQNATTADLCSITGKPLPLLTAVFLALSIPVLMMSSGIHLYDKLNRFLLSRPALDLLDVPMLMTLYYSSGAGVTGAGDYGKEIVWLLRMLVAGFADESVLTARVEDEALPDSDEMEVDGEVKQAHASLFLEPYKRRHVLPLVMGLFTARTATTQIKNLALDLVARLVDSAHYAAQRHKRGGVVRLLRRYGIRVWLAVQKALLQNESTGSDTATTSGKRAKEGPSAARRRAEVQALLARLNQLESQMEEISSMP